MKQTGSLGREFQDGETILHQGERADCMYVIQEGKVEIVRHEGDKEVSLAVRTQGEFVGEMALFDHEERSADVRAVGQVRLITVDRKNLLHRITEDPSLAFRIIETMSGRIRELTQEVARLRNASG